MTEVFETAGKTEGLEVWRVENLRLVKNEDAKLGNYYSGDSYVLLNTKLVRNRMSFEIHFWLGDQSSQDERGAAAILSVQLSQELAGDAVIYRQVQGHESIEFMAFYRSGVRYMTGGVDSGFKHAKTNVSESKRLLRVKGRRAVRATELPMKWNSFNHGDCFVLDYENVSLKITDGRCIVYDTVDGGIVIVYQWNGQECNHFEKLKADIVAKSIINDEKGGKGKLIKVEDGRKIPDGMKEALEGDIGDIQPSLPDDVAINGFTSSTPATLYHVCADTGKLVIEKVGHAPFDQEQLDSGDSYILDNGAHGKIFVWKGKGASREERVGALQNATKFIEEKNYSPTTGIEIMAQDSETVLFKQFFKSWRTKNDTIGFGKKFTMNRVAKLDQTKFDMKSLGNSKLAAKYRMVDDGSGDLKIWIVDKDMTLVNEKRRGVFFSGNCYVMLYTYNRSKFIIYHWIGRQASIRDITHTSHQVVQLSRQHNNRPVQIRVVQGKEPPHLLSLFKGKPMVIITGKSRDVDLFNLPTTLIQVFCTGIGGRAIQVPTAAKSLNSNDAFVFKSKTECYIWIGVGSSNDEMAGAKYVAGLISSNKPAIIGEEFEDATFWWGIGGKESYANHPRLQDDLSENPPRLFGISDASGRLIVEEVPGEFTQADLCQDDVMMLDVWDQIFIWIGKFATDQERESAPKLAKEFIECDPRKRDVDISIVTVRQGYEPPLFTGFLPSWNPSFNYGLV